MASQPPMQPPVPPGPGAGQTNPPEIDPRILAAVALAMKGRNAAHTKGTLKKSPKAKAEALFPSMGVK